MMRTSIVRYGWLFTLLMLLLLAALPHPALAAPPHIPASYYRIDDGATDYISPISAGADDVDSGAGGVCTLRDALTASNAGITTATTTITAEGCRVTLVGSAPVPPVYVINLPLGGYIYTLNGSELPIQSNSVHIVGNTSADTILQATDDPIGTPADHRVMVVIGTPSLFLSGLTVRYGNCDATCNGTPASPGYGGGLDVGGPLTLDDVVVTENTATLGGGGLRVDGTTTVTDSQITANTSAGVGGGVYSNHALAVTNSTISGNTADDTGGGLALYGNQGANITASSIVNNHALNGGGLITYMNQATTTIADTTVAGNTASNGGGGILIQGSTTLVVTQSTISGNTADSHGGGVWLGSSGTQVTLANTTISGNTAVNSAGGGLLMGAGSSLNLTNVTMTGNSALTAAGGLHMDDGTLTMTNSLVVGNSASFNPASADCAKLTPSAVVTTNHNVIGATTTCPTSGQGDIHWAGTAAEVVDPTLSNNGGPTLTHALHPDSPAIDAGNQAVCSDPGGWIAGVDQRGEPHIDGDFDQIDACDIGAYDAYLPVALPGTTSQADFGTVYIGSSSAAVPLTILNRGHVDLQIGTVSVSGQDASEFGLSNDLCSSAVVAPGATCSFDLTFTPGFPVGLKSASIALTSNGPTFGGIPLTGTAVEVAPDAPALVGPADGLYTSDTTPLLEWNSAANASTYVIEIASDDEFMNMVQFVSSVSNLDYTASPALPTGTYYWRVTAFASGGTPGPASETRTLYIDNIPPGVPVLSVPADKAVIADRTPALTLLPVVGAVSYQFQIAVDADFSTVDVDETQAGTTYTQPIDLNYGVYWWRARAIDAAGNLSGWSAPSLLTISSLIAPANGATTALAKPAFTWAAVSSATQYQLVVDDDANFASPVIDKTQTTASFTPGAALANGLYYWHVQAMVGGVPTGWTPTWTVTVSASSATPAVPVLVLPASGGFVNDNTPMLTWNAASSAVAYQVQIDTVSTFPTPDQDVTGADTFYTTSTLPDGKVYWRVRGVNAYGVVGSWTSARAFTVDTVIPATPVLSTPQDQGSTTDTTPTFTVVAAAGAAKYRFQISKDNLFSTILIDQTVGSTSYTVPSNLALTYYTYNWRAAAVDAAGNESPFSAGRMLFVAPMTAPGVNALTTDTTPTFTWVAVPGASHYFLVLNDEPNFINPILNQMVTGTSYTPAVPLAEDIYYWRVEPFVDVDVLLPPIRTLTVSATRPAAPELSLPLNGASSPTGNVALVLAGSVPGAVKYEYQVDDNSAFSSPYSAVVNNLDPIYAGLPLANQKYYWRARALNSLNAPGPWSAARSFIVDSTDPAIPAFNAPANGAITADTTPTLSVLAVTGASQYRFQVYIFGTPTMVFDSTVGSTSVTTPALPYGRYTWRVGANDAAGNESDWSTNRTFDITFLSSPANNAQVPSLTPTFTWLAVTGAIQYHLQADNNADFSSPEVDVTQSGLTYTVPAPLAAQTYHWRVEAITGGGSTGWTPARKVFLSDQKPAAPALVSPSAGFSTNDTTPTLSWNSVAGSSVQYWIQIDNDSTFASPAVDASTSAAISYTPGALVVGTYYWRVAAHSYGVFGAWSASRSIIIDTVPAAVPALSAPANGASTADRTPALSVTAVSGAKQYQFQIADESTFAAPVIDQTGATTSFTVPNGQALPYDVYYWRARTFDAAGNPSAWSGHRALTITILSAPAANTSITNQKPAFSWVAISGVAQYQLVVDNDPDFSSPVIDKILGGTSFTATAALPVDIYYWRVLALGNTLPWMPYRKLTITPPPPGAPVLKLPATAAVTNDTTPYFKWEPAASGQPSASYGIQIDNSSTFSSPERNVKGLANPYYTSSQLPPGVYYWRVRAFNDLGVAGAWSTSRSFTIDTTAPGVPVITDPAPNAVIMNGTPTLSVLAIADAKRYRFQIAKDANFTIIAVDVNSINTSYTLATWQALLPGTYYLRVQSIDAAGNTSAWSTVRTFTR